MSIRIIGTGSFLPERIMTNEDMAEIVDTTDEWISSRAGIKTRHIVSHETTTSLAVGAAKRALDDANVQAEKIDLIIVATVTGDKAVPSTSCQVQAGIGAVNAMAFDINAACSGFMAALNTSLYLQNPAYNTALVIGAESLSKIVDWTDRTTCVLFGDGAGAAVVRCDDDGIFAFTQGADGSRGGALNIDNHPIINPFVQGDITDMHLKMNGQAVFKFAVKKVPECIEKLLEECNVSKTEVKYYILHQANLRIIKTAAKRLGENEEKFPVNLCDYGNTSSASVPILLDEMRKSTRIRRGDKVVLAGFGGGLTWAAAILEV